MRLFVFNNHLRIDTRRGLDSEFTRHRDKLFSPGMAHHFVQGGTCQQRLGWYFTDSRLDDDGIFSALRIICVINIGFPIGNEEIGYLPWYLAEDQRV